MNKKFIKSLVAGILSLGLIASCSMHSKCHHKCENRKSEEGGKCSSKPKDANKKQPLEKTTKSEKSSAVKAKNTNDKKSN